MTLRDYIRTHYGSCDTMEQKPRACACMGLIVRHKMDASLQHLCPNWVSVPDRNYDDMLRRQRADLGNRTELAT